MKKYYDMDSVSMVYPALGGHIFRVCAVFKDKIDTQILFLALKSLECRFPIVFTCLEKTFTGYVHVLSSDLDIIKDGRIWINPPELTDTRKPCFRIYIDDKLLSVDFFHGNADGSMGNKFLCALIENYCLISEGKALDILPLTDEALLKDPYKIFYEKTKINTLAEKKSFDLSFKSQGCDYHRTVCFNIKTADIKNLVKSRGFTVNDFLCSVLYQAIYKGTQAKNSKDPVTISIGIDLRKRYNFNSHRNFISFSNIRFPNRGEQDIFSIMEHFKNERKKAVSKENLKSTIASIYLIANNPLIKYAPRAIKDPLIKKIYWFISKKGVTTTFSNLGVNKTDPCCEKYIERFEGYLGVIEGKMNVMAIGFSDSVSFCLTFNSKDRCVDSQVESILKENEIPYSIIQREY